mmetsp:Transcript_16402/g.40905  ORF Transcript_16402/g.40905 Transcript_16402/m.40905 type:complete len:222 (+) Transcript_16402:1744-2409(+)
MAATQRSSFSGTGMPAALMVSASCSRSANGTLTRMACSRHSASSAAASSLCAPVPLLPALPWPAPLEPGAPSRDMSDLTVDSSEAGLERPCSRATSSLMRPLTSRFSGASSTCSKQPNGSVTDDGSRMSPGSLPRSPARFLDLAPTTPSLYSSMPMAHLPHHLGTSILSPLTGLPAAWPAPAAAPLADAGGSLQLTAPDAVVVKCSTLPFMALIWSRGSLS